MFHLRQRHHPKCAMLSELIGEVHIFSIGIASKALIALIESQITCMFERYAHIAPF
jgi:hypothetical protein